MNMHISFLLQLYRILASKLYSVLPMENMNVVVARLYRACWPTLNGANRRDKAAQLRHGEDYLRVL
jgi:hypothetical protein